MLKPVESPLSCFGQEHQPKTERCRTCPHREPCRVYMGDRLDRVTLDQVTFALVPETILRKHEEPDEDVRDVQALYSEIHMQVFGSMPVGYVGIHTEKLSTLAERAKVSIPMFILISMYGHAQVYNGAFSPSMLVDNRALNRVHVYAEACRAKYGSVSVSSFDKITHDDLEGYDLEGRMLRSEILAGSWIIEWKMENEGAPYDALFIHNEEKLDPNWLAIEPRYEPVLKAFAEGVERPVQSETTRHLAVMAYRRMKKYKHQAVGNFRARERIMVQALKTVLEKQDYSITDFEARTQPVTDPLLFWNRLAAALQHLECLDLINHGIGRYAAV